MGTLINTATVILGGTLGLLLGVRLPERTRETVMHGLGLVTLVIGFKLALGTSNVLIPLGSLLLGGILGEWWRIEERLEGLGDLLERRLSRGSGASISRGFVVASLLCCVGPMAIVGSIQDGLTGDFNLLTVKAILDGFASIALASTLGLGVPLSALTVLTYQGGLTLLAIYLGPLLSQPMIDEMSATGGLLIIGIAMLLLEIKKIRVANFLPAIFIAPFIVAIKAIIGG
jgi:uncharacterized membrane protein YqgA involved in biofilm formation